MAHFLVLICELVVVLFFILVVNLKFFNSHFPTTTTGLDLFSDMYLNKLVK